MILDIIDPYRKVKKEIEKVVSSEEKKISFILSFYDEHKDKEVSFMNLYFDKIISSTEKGISVLEEGNNFIGRNKFIKRLDSILNKAKIGKDTINN